MSACNRPVLPVHSVDHPRSDLTPERLLRLITSAPNAFHRRDIDVSLEAAVKMARFDQVAGISATYYVWARCPFYSLFSRDGEDALWKILESGHRVGAHVDAVGRTPEVAVARDLELLGSAWSDVFADRLVSFHMPSPDVLWRDFGKFESAYAARWEGRYVSDSRGEWTDEKQALVSDDMQVALHPEHWMGA